MTPNEVAATITAAVHTIDCDVALIALVMPSDGNDERRAVTTGLMITAERPIPKTTAVEALVSAMDAVAALLERQEAEEVAGLIRGWMDKLGFLCQSRLAESTPVKNNN